MKIVKILISGRLRLITAKGLYLYGFTAAVSRLSKEGCYTGCLPKKNAFYEGVPCKNGFRKETADIPLLIGTVFGEFGSFAPPKYRKHEMSKEQQKSALIKEVGEENTGFSVGKAAIGALLVGPVGVVGGALGKKKCRYVCSKCGYSGLYDM